MQSVDRPLSVGSSPRVRGTSIATASSSERIWFIPACAGNIFPCRRDRRDNTVHPRVCGEHSLAMLARRALIGSSPRVRGTFCCPSLRPLSQRFIPACAGNMDRTKRRCEYRPVHPRVCGEHMLLGLPIANTGGSSPRVRGTLSSRFIIPLPPRFIPACAGNIPGTGYAASPTAVHPRVCGEHENRPPILGKRSGSSPRVRGTYLIVTACYSLGYMPCKIATDYLTPDSPTPHMPKTHFTQAKKIRVEDRQNPQVSGGLCQRFQTQTPRHWGRPKQSQHHRRR